MSKRKDQANRRKRPERMPFDRRDPSFTSGSRYQQAARNIMADSLVWLWRKKVISDKTAWRIMSRFLPAKEKNGGES